MRQKENVLYKYTEPFNRDVMNNTDNNRILRDLDEKICYFQLFSVYTLLPFIDTTV